MITLEHFDEVDMRVGTITAVSLNKRARKPAYKITVDLGDFRNQEQLRSVNQL